MKALRAIIAASALILASSRCVAQADPSLFDETRMYISSVVLDSAKTIVNQEKNKYREYAVYKTLLMNYATITDYANKKITCKTFLLDNNEDTLVNDVIKYHYDGKGNIIKKEKYINLQYTDDEIEKGINIPAYKATSILPSGVEEYIKVYDGMYSENKTECDVVTASFNSKLKEIYAILGKR